MPKTRALRLFYLTVNRWAMGGGIHYWPSLMEDDGSHETIDVSRVITAKESARLNKHDRLANWRPGDTTASFDDEQSAIVRAIEVAEERCGGDGFIMLRGSVATISPLPVLFAGPGADKLPPLWQRFEEAGEYEGRGPWPEADAVSDEWEAEIKRLRGVAT